MSQCLAYSTFQAIQTSSVPLWFLSEVNWDKYLNKQIKRPWNVHVWAFLSCSSQTHLKQGESRSWNFFFIKTELANDSYLLKLMTWWVLVDLPVWFLFWVHRKVNTTRIAWDRTYYLRWRMLWSSATRNIYIQQNECGCFWIHVFRT